MVEWSFGFFGAGHCHTNIFFFQNLLLINKSLRRSWSCIRFFWHNLFKITTNPNPHIYCSIVIQWLSNFRHLHMAIYLINELAKSMMHSLKDNMLFITNQQLIDASSVNELSFIAFRFVFINNWTGEYICTYHIVVVYVGISDWR